MSKSPAVEYVRKITGEDIKAERVARGWTQAELATRAETNQQTVNRIEQGQTRRSSALPKILETLGLAEGMNIYTESELKRSFPGDKIPDSGPMKLGLPKAGDYRHLPIFSRWTDSLGWMQEISRPYPVETIDEAYGLIVNERDMVPVLYPGDIVITNPYLPAQVDAEVVYCREVDGRTVYRVRTFLADEDENFRFKVWSPSEELVIPKNQISQMHLVVAKISRFR